MMNTTSQIYRIEAGGVELEGDLVRPDEAIGIVLFAHGSGSSRFSSRNRYVAGKLNDAGLATFLLDLLTEQEERVDVRTREFRFDIPRLAERMSGAVDWADQEDATADLPIGLFGASTGAAVALLAAADRPAKVKAVVSRGGRPDLADDKLALVQAPTRLIIGGNDVPVIGMNREAEAKMTASTDIQIVPGATHLFEEPGKLDIVADLTADWFNQHLPQYGATDAF